VRECYLQARNADEWRKRWDLTVDVDSLSLLTRCRRVPLVLELLLCDWPSVDPDLSTAPYDQKDLCIFCRTYTSVESLTTVASLVVISPTDFNLSATTKLCGVCRAMLCISAAIAGMRCLSVRPSVRLSKRLSCSWVAPKRNKMSSKLFHHR